MGKKVRTVRRDFDFDEGIVIVELLDWGADFEVGIKNEEAVFFVSEADFGACGEHAF